MTAAVLRDVTLRDGLQLTGKPLATERKVEIVRALLDAGVQQLEVGSMARPDLVPPMANTVEVLEALDARRAGPVLGVGGNAASRGEGRHRGGPPLPVLPVGIGCAQSRPTSAGPPTPASRRCPTRSPPPTRCGGSLQLCIATAFTCPFDGPVDPERGAADRRRTNVPRAQRKSCCATRWARRSPVKWRRWSPRWPGATDGPIVFHGHDTWGLGVANSMAAIEAGATHRGRVPRRAGRLPVRAGRGRQHPDRGSAVRHPPVLVHARQADGAVGHRRRHAR